MSERSAGRPQLAPRSEPDLRSELDRQPGRIRHVLLDADGVLQRVDPGWVQAAGPLLGERAMALLEAFWALEGPALAGRGDVLAALTEALRQTEIEAEAAELYPRIWLQIEVLDHTRGLLDALRGQGLGVHLGTNQTALRAGYMRRALGYDDLFDHSFYSCDLGATKPDPAFFARAAAGIGVESAEILFVDDSASNVAAATAAGLAAVHWRYTDGAEKLAATLAAYGVAW